MIRGTLTNIRIRNQMLDGVVGYSRLHPRRRPAGLRLRRSYELPEAGTPLVVWVVSAGSVKLVTGQPKVPRCSASKPSSPNPERIHRSNLIVWACSLEFPAGESADSLG